MRNIVWVPVYDPDYNRRAMNGLAKQILKNENERGEVTYEIKPVEVKPVKINDAKWANTWGSWGSGYLEIARDKAIKATEDTMSDDNKSGRKYFRPIKGAKCAIGGHPESLTMIDVYAVAETFDVTCPARTHALKKILLAGDRGKNDTIADLDEARDAITRAIELEEQREAGR